MSKTKAILFQPKYEVGEMIWVMFSNKPMRLRIERRLFEDDGDEEIEEEIKSSDVDVTTIINAAEQRISVIKYVLFVPADSNSNRVSSDVTVGIKENKLFTSKSALLKSL